MNAILIVDPKVPVRMNVSVNRLLLFVLPVLNLVQSVSCLLAYAT